MRESEAFAGTVFSEASLTVTHLIGFSAEMTLTCQIKCLLIIDHF